MCMSLFVDEQVGSLDHWFACLELCGVEEDFILVLRVVLRPDVGLHHVTLRHSLAEPRLE